MGYGEYGGGGSVSWKVDHETANGNVNNPGGGNKKADGHDPVPRNQMGLSKGAPEGHFKLEVFYNSESDADAARKSVSVAGSTLLLYVRSNTGGNPGGNPPNPPQIRVSW